MNGVASEKTIVSRPRSWNGRSRSKPSG